MFSRFLALLLAVGYLAGQLAAVPHAHAMEPAGHALRAHVHGKLANHHHGHSHHGHHHDNGHSVTQQSSPSSDNSAPEEHDDHCTYLPDSVTAGMQAKVQLPEMTVAYAFLADTSHPPFTARFENAGRPFASPNILRSGCDLCLTLRTLLI